MLFDDAGGCRIGMVVQGASGRHCEMRWLDTHLSSRGIVLRDAQQLCFALYSSDEDWSKFVGLASDCKEFQQR